MASGGAVVPERWPRSRRPSSIGGTVTAALEVMGRGLCSASLSLQQLVQRRRPTGELKSGAQQSCGRGTGLRSSFSQLGSLQDATIGRTAVMSGRPTCQCEMPMMLRAAGLAEGPACIPVVISGE